MKVGKEKKSRKKCSYPRKNKTVPALCGFALFDLTEAESLFLRGQRTADSGPQLLRLCLGSSEESDWSR